MSARNDIYLNALCLTAYAPGAPSLKIAKAVCDTYDKMSVEERTTLPKIGHLYVKILKDVVEGKIDLANKAEASSLLLSYQDDPVFAGNRYSFDELRNTLLPDELPPPSKIKLLFNKVKNKIIFFKTSQRIRAMMMSNQRMNREEDVDKQQALLQDLLAAADSLRTDVETTPSDEEDATPVDEIDMADKASVMKAFRQQKKKRSAVGITFGLQGLNRMFGPSHGAAYGEAMAFAARSHNGKSEMLMNMARWHVQLNDPPDTGGKLPIVMFISLENEIYENLLMWFKAAYANAYHKEPDGLSEDEIVEYVMRAFNKRGFRFLVYRRMGETFGFAEYVKLVEKVETRLNGKVVATYMDYVTLCKRCPEDKNFNDAKQIQLMVGRFKDFANHREMFFCTGLQLDTEAARLAASGVTNIVKKYGQAHLADCRGARNELDILFFLEVETNHVGIPFMTIAWSKHRYVNDTPSEDKYTAYPFTDRLGLISDIDGPDRSVKDIYAEQEKTEEENKPEAIFA